MKYKVITVAESTDKIVPILIISSFLMPSPYTIALGGVPTGKIKEHDADIPIANIKISSGIPRGAPNSIGINTPANPVLLIKLVNIMVVEIIVNIMIIGLKPPKTATSFSAKKALAPLSATTPPKHNAPPNKIKVPQSTFLKSLTSTKLNTNNKIMANMAIIESKYLMSNTSLK